MKSHVRLAARQPTVIPRKHARSTMLVKNVRKITMLPNQRMHVSSKKRMTKLIRNKSRYARRCRWLGEAAFSSSAAEIGASAAEIVASAAILPPSTRETAIRRREPFLLVIPEPCNDSCPGPWPNFGQGDLSAEPLSGNGDPESEIRQSRQSDQTRSSRSA